MHMPTHRVVVLLNVAELAKVKAAAGLVPMSAWIRHAAMAAADGERPKNFETGVEMERREVRRGGSVVDRIMDTTHAVLRKTENTGVRDDRGVDEAGTEGGTAEAGVVGNEPAERAARRQRNHPAKGKAKHGKRGRQAVESGKCSAAVAPGLYCTSCGKRH